MFVYRMPSIKLHFAFITAYFNKDRNVAANGDLKCPHNDVQKTADHIQFLITETGPRTPKTPKTPCSFSSDGGSDKELEAFQMIADKPLISPQIFCHVFPFHLMFDRNMQVVQAGTSVARVIPKVVEQNCHLLEILEPIRPHIQLSFQTILSHISTIYVLKTKQNVMLEPDMFMRLKVNFYEK